MIGTHQSLTYAKPLQWYFKPFHFVAKCQERDYKEQYKLGVRLFDIRIKPYKGTWRVAHGSMIFDIDLYEVLRYLNSKGDCIIQISLEYNKEPKNSDVIIESFIKEVQNLINSYPNIKFFGFGTKWNWNKVYSYQNEPNIRILQLVSSTTGNQLDDWCPSIYAKVFRKDIEKLKPYLQPNVWLSIDFI